MDSTKDIKTTIPVESFSKIPRKRLHSTQESKDEKKNSETENNKKQKKAIEIDLTKSSLEENSEKKIEIIDLTGTSSEEDSENEEENSNGCYKYLFSDNDSE